MASVFEIFGEIAINAESAYRTIDRTAGKAKGLTQTFGKVGQAAVKFGKTVIAGSAAAAAGIGVLLKASVGNYAEYEQLVGGVETLFKNSSGKVMEYANSAYKTAGMSANKYMETVTAFSASLLQSLGGDTDKAADVANMAVTDMSDNANKMGTDITMIQNAYQGFAKQNYTMLDNLKLGYGGTKTEMNRLLKDAQKIQKANGNNVKYSIKNLDDIIEAIHVVQTEMGITGTTAAEANDTISGSLATLGSAWENVLAGMSDSNADMDAIFRGVFDAAENVARNIGKVLPAFTKNLGQMLVSLGKYAGEKIKTGWTDKVWPAIQDFMKVHFGVDLPDWSSLITSISDGWTKTVWPGIQDFFKVNFGIDLPDWTTMVTDISSGWNETIWPSIQEMFKTKFGIELPTWETVQEEIKTLWDNVKAGITGYFSAVFSIFTPDESGEGGNVATRILEWWAGVVLAIGNLMLSPFGIEFPDVVQAITDWWNDVKSQVSLKLGFEVDEPGSGTHETENGRTMGGGTSKHIVDLSASEDSEANIQTDVDDYDLESDVALEAAAGSKANLQGACDNMGLTAEVTLKPKMSGISGWLSGLFNGSHADGLDRVPFDGYRAILHKDEMVLRASEAAVYRGEKQPKASAFNRRNTRETSDQPITVNLTVNGNSGSPYEIAGAVRDALEMVRWGV